MSKIKSNFKRSMKLKNALQKTIFITDKKETTYFRS